MVYILLRLIGYPSARLLQNVVSGAELQRFSRASLDASRHDNISEVLFTLFLCKRLPIPGQWDGLIGAVSAVSTLLNLGSKRVPFRGGHAPRACPNAVAAGDAFVGIGKYR